MDLAVEYAKVRRQFDQPIGSFQAVQHLCVDMYETVELARSGVIHALWAADAADAAERHLAALRAKAFAGRLATVGDTAIQVFGGIGFTWEHDAHLYLKRLLGWSAFLGGTGPISRRSRRGARASEPTRRKGLTCLEMLSGVRVVELASWTYVPAAGAALSDWGADVIKVEDVRGGDPGRSLVIGPFTKEAARAHVDFILEIGNRGKRSIALDVKSETGREYFGRLLATADVFLTNWLPGALERARLTVEDIRSFNPNIIIARGTGIGVRGPDRDKGGFDAATYLSRGGVSYTLTPFGEHARRAGARVRRPAGRHHARRRPVRGAVPPGAHRRAVASSTRHCSPRRCGRSRRRSRSPTSSTSTESQAHRQVWR